MSDGSAVRQAVRPWRRTARRTVVRDRWIHLRAETWITGDGVTLDPWWVLDWPDWVHVVAITADDRLVLVRQFRPGIGEATLELPGGVMDPGDPDPATAARRELAEETGFAAPALEPVVTLRPDPAHAANRIHFLLARGVVPSAPQRLDAGEEIAVELHPIPAVLAGLAEGAMVNACHAGGLLLALRAAGRIGF